MRKWWRSAFAALVCLAVSTPTLAEVVRIEIERREDVLGGSQFGDVGPYEKIVGTIYFAFDPDNAMNARIVDLDLAPRNAEGRVEARANFMVLRPKQVPPGGGVALLEVSNRGGKATMRYFNGAVSSLDPTEEEHFGDALMMRLGLTVIWVGWQPDLPMREGLLRLHVPTASLPEGPIEGLARADWTVDQFTNSLELGHRGHQAYPVTDPDDPEHVLTVRDGRMSPRRIVPRHTWRFARREGDRIVDASTSVYSVSGFEAGKIYEMVYRTRDPRVVGLGLAAIRDMMSYAKHDPSSPFAVRTGLAMGISQTGRFLRHFVYQGFNTDEEGRKVFDGLLVHTAGAGRGSFNHRFAQPSRDAHRYSAFFYPTDIFPFTSRSQTDPETGVGDGLFAHSFDETHLPRIFYTNTGYEYWGRAASLIHTTPDGAGDVALYPNERIYHLASGQHSVGRFPPSNDAKLGTARAYRSNPLNFLLTLRALLPKMVAWARDDDAPPASAYPTVADGSLVSPDEVDFPDVPGVTFPSVIHEAYRADYGPRWTEGIIDNQPPNLGPSFASLVSQVDNIGNERVGVRAVEILVPVATYTPWNLRFGYPGSTQELTDFQGTFIPLARTEVERQTAGDPRPSLESLYEDRTDYLTRVEAAARQLVAQGFLLEEDIPTVISTARDRWDWIFDES
jgi:hypothetical protein